jgi:hypothetical protein
MKKSKINEVINLLEDELSWVSAEVKQFEKSSTLILECMPGSSIKKEIQKILMDKLISAVVCRGELRGKGGSEPHNYYIILN